jgi:TP901 family phage tail tape measure protein
VADAVAGVRLEVDAKNALQPLRRVSEQSKKVEKAFGGVAGKLRGAGGAFAATGQGAKVAAVGVKGFGAALNVALGPIGAALTALTSLSAIFNTLKQQDFAEAKVRSLGVNSEELVAQLKDVSTELQGQASVVDLTAAAYDVASAGFNRAADASNVLKAASLGATGGFSDINTVANATTSVLNAYGLSADKAGKLVDGFIQTQNDGKIVIGEYANNIGKLAPLAASLNVPLEEINGAIAAVTATGINAEIGITGIRSALAKLGANSKEATDILKTYGVEINATTIGQEGFVKTLEKLSKVSNKTDLLKIVGVEAGQVVAPLLNDLEKLNQLVENQGNASGVAARAQAEAANTIEGALKRVQTAFTNAFADQSVLGEALKATFLVVAVTVEGLATALNLIIAPIKAGSNAVRAFAETIAKALGIDATASLAGLEEGWQSIRKAIDFVANLIEKFGQAFGALIADLVLIVFRFGDDIQKAIGEPIGVVQGLWRDFVGFFGSAWQQTVSDVDSVASGLWTSISNGVQGIVGSIGNAFRNAFVEASKQVFAFLNQFPWLKGLLEKGASIGSAISGAVGNALGGLTKAFNNAAKTITQSFAGPSVSSGPGSGRQTSVAPPAVTGGPGGAGSRAGGGGRGGQSPEEILKKQTEAGEKLIEQQRRRLALLLEQDDLTKELLRLDFEREDASRKVANAAADQREELLKTIEAVSQAQAGLAIGESLAQGVLDTEKALNNVRSGFAEGAKIDEEIKKANDEVNIFKQTLSGIGEVLGSTLRSAIDGLISGTAKLNDILSDVLKQVGSLLINAGLNALGNSGGSIGSIFSFLGFGKRASGGPVRPGGTYLVGERGPELLQMGSQGGFVQSNTSEAMRRYSGNSGGRGASTMTVNYNVTEVNGMRFVTEDQFRAGLDQAAKNGAKMGQSMTISTLKNSRSQRSKIGL